MGFGIDQHGRPDDATKAAVRAVRNAIEFNSIPGVITHLPGGRHEMLIHVKLGIPLLSSSLLSMPSNSANKNDEELNNNRHPLQLMHVDVLEVAKVFPYGKLLPIELSVGGLCFHTGRVVEELGDTNDVGVCVAACVSLGYGESMESKNRSTTVHATYNTKDGY